MIDFDQLSDLRDVSDEAGLNHERWELELGYAEAKIQILERQEALRSKTAQNVRQEIWGILLERRPDRRYKRHVKIKMSGYERNPGRPLKTEASS